MSDAYADEGPLDLVPIGVQLSEYEHVLRQVVPNAELHSSGYGLEVLFQMRVTMHTTRAVNEQHAIETMRAYGEQIRARGIRALGVQPILDGYRAEADATRERNRVLSSQLDATRNQLAAARDLIAAYEESTDD